MSISAAILIRSFFGVLLFKQNAQPATQAPHKNEDTMIPGRQNTDGGKKKNTDTAMKIILEVKNSLRAAFFVFINNPQNRSPANSVAIPEKTVTEGSKL